jgi:hypothetical protein
VGPTAGLDGCGESRLHREWIPVPSSPKHVTMPTTLPRPTHRRKFFCKVNICPYPFSVHFHSL